MFSRGSGRGGWVVGSLYTQRDKNIYIQFGAASLGYGEIGAGVSTDDLPLGERISIKIGA